jgi:HPt (histidine-containing phosphotransfer) domain-containing protein
MNSPSMAGPPAVSAAAGDVLDAQALARLQELDPGGQGGLVARVLATYAASLQRLLDQLRVARDAADRPAVRLVAHTLKSSSASVGALALSARCAEIERRLRDGDDDGLEVLLDALAEEGARVLVAVQQRLMPQR